MRGIVITNVELIPQECRFNHGGIPSIASVHPHQRERIQGAMAIALS